MVPSCGSRSASVIVLKPICSKFRRRIVIGPDPPRPDGFVLFSRSPARSPRVADLSSAILLDQMNPDVAQTWFQESVEHPASVNQLYRVVADGVPAVFAAASARRSTLHLWRSTGTFG